MTIRAAGAAQSHFFPLPVQSWTWDMTDRVLESTHLPVLLEEVLSFLQPERGGLFVDATLGLGGHAQAILKAGTQAEVLGIDAAAVRQRVHRARLMLRGFLDAALQGAPR